MGTSATIGGGDVTRSKQVLVEFAEEVFGEPMSVDAVVGEDRSKMDEVFPAVRRSEHGAIIHDTLDTPHGGLMGIRSRSDPARAAGPGRV